MSEFNNAGSAVTPGSGYTGGRVEYSGGGGDRCLWKCVDLEQAGMTGITKILGGAAPVAPLAVGVTNTTTGVKP